MLHATAREAISRILAGDGFGDRAVAMTLAGSLTDVGVVPERLRQRAFARSLAMAPDRGAQLPFVPDEGRLAADDRELIDQLSPALAGVAGPASAQGSMLLALATLWPHVGGQERAGMRRRFLAGITALVPTGGEVTSAELRAWQRDLPTSSGSQTPNAASLALMLNEPDPRRAYHALADHLGASLDPTTLTWVLGGLAVQELIKRRDHEGGIVSCLLGTMALGRLAPRVATEHVAALISKIALQLWWWRHHGNLAPIRSCLDGAARPLAEAVRSGDITAAQRAARAVSADPRALWEELAQLIDDAAAWNDGRWLRALSVITVLAWRSGEALSPDDAAATATVLAGLVYQDKPGSVTVPA
jgi:hypothetical protein